MNYNGKYDVDELIKLTNIIHYCCQYNYKHIQVCKNGWIETYHVKRRKI